VRMVRTLRAELGVTQGTVQRVATQLGYGVESVRMWVKQADIDCCRWLRAATTPRRPAPLGSRAAGRGADPAAGRAVGDELPRLRGPQAVEGGPTSEDRDRSGSDRPADAGRGDRGRPTVEAGEDHPPGSGVGAAPREPLAGTRSNSRCHHLRRHAGRPRPGALRRPPREHRQRSQQFRRRLCELRCGYQVCRRSVPPRALQRRRPPQQCGVLCVGSRAQNIRASRCCSSPIPDREETAVLRAPRYSWPRHLVPDLGATCVSGPVKCAVSVTGEGGFDAKRAHTAGRGAGLGGRCLFLSPREGRHRWTGGGGWTRVRLVLAAGCPARTGRCRPSRQRAAPESH